MMNETLLGLLFLALVVILLALIFHLRAEKEVSEKEIEGKPPEIAAKIVAGKLEKNLYSQKCLMHMPFPKEDKFKGTYGEFLASKSMSSDSVTSLPSGKSRELDSTGLYHLTRRNSHIHADVPTPNQKRLHGFPDVEGGRWN